MSDRIYYNTNTICEDDLTFDFKKIFLALWSRKFLIAKIFVAVFLFFVLMTFISAKKYTVDADLYINKSNNSNIVDMNPYVISELGAGGGMAAMLSGGGTLANDLEIMQSPLVIDNVIKENDLRFKKIFGIIPTRKTGQLLTTEKFLKKKVKFEIKKGTNVVTISYKSKDKDLAYNVVTSIINNYITVQKQLNSEKSKSDKKIIEQNYVEAKKLLEAKVAQSNGLPEQAMVSAAQMSAMSAFSSSARKALSSITGQVVSGQKSRIEVTEEAAKVAELSKRLEWAKIVDEMSESSKVIVLKAPRILQDYEQTSPKLFTNILLGIVFGIIGALIAVIYKEITDKKLSYSMLGEEIIYNIGKDFVDIKAFLLAHKKEKIAMVIYNGISHFVISELEKLKNIIFVKADISEEFEQNIEKSTKVILVGKIGQTDSSLYKKTKKLLERMNKKVILEILE